MEFKKPIPYTLCASFLAALGILFPALWVLVPLGLTVFFYSLWNSAVDMSGAMARGFLFGMVTAGSSIIWFWATLPIDWLPGDPVSQFFAVGIIWVYVSCALALGTVGASAVLFAIRKSPAILLTITTSFVWVVQEALRMLLYSFATAGPGSLYGAHFSVSALGYALAESGYFLSLAHPGGIYSLSFVTALMAALIALPCIRRTLVVPASIGLLVVISFPLFTTHQTPVLSQPLTVSVYAFSPTQTENALVPDLNATVVVFPENSEPPPAEKRSDALYIYAHYSLTSENGSAQLIYDKENKKISYDKKLLMPLGEYVPLFTNAVFAPIQNGNLHERVDGLRGSLSAGHTPEIIYTHHDVNIGGLLCSENLSPMLYHTLGRQGAEVLVNLANTSWFHGNERVMHMLFTMSKVHAVQNNAYFIFAAKGGYSFILNRKGEVLIRSKENTNDLITHTLY